MMRIVCLERIRQCRSFVVRVEIANEDGFWEDRDCEIVASACRGGTRSNEYIQFQTPPPALNG